MRWEAQLSLVSEVIDEWLTLQRAWMYLEPIFSSPDILQQLPQEGKKYSSVDRIWRKVSAPSKHTALTGLVNASSQDEGLTHQDPCVLIEGWTLAMHQQWQRGQTCHCSVHRGVSVLSGKTGHVFCVACFIPS